MKTLYVTDLDGTLLNSQGRLSDFTVDTVNRLIGQGMNFTVATARSVSSAAGLIERLDLKLPCVMMNGVFLTDVKTRTQAYVCKMPTETAAKVIDAFVSSDRPPFVYSFREDITCEYTCLKNDYERNFAAVRKKLYKSFDRVENYDVSGNTVYINGIDREEIMSSVAEKVGKIAGVKYSYYLDTYSRDKYFVEVYSEKAGKHNTINVLKDMYGFDRVVAFGDNGNDVEMLKNADIAVAVGNAQPSAAAVADRLIGTNDQDGVARYLLSLFESGML